VCYDAAESYHVPRDRGSIAATIIAGMRQAQQAAPLGRILPGQREEKESERLGAEQAGHHGDQRSGVTSGGGRAAISTRQIDNEGGRTDRPPSNPRRVAPTPRRAPVDQLFGAAGAAGAVFILCMWWADALALWCAWRDWRRRWRLCDPLVP
jgi:hypothetical protein